MTADAHFSDELELWLHGDQLTLGEMGEVFAEKSFAVMILFLMAVPALPLPTGGVTHAFEAIAVVLAAEMVLGRRTIWLPASWQRRELGTTTTKKTIPFIVRRVRWIERFSRPRGAWLFKQRWMHRLLGLLLMAFAIAAAFAPPFSGLDTLPALGAAGVALAIILEDAFVLLIATILGTGGVVLMITIGATLVHFVRHLI